MPRSRELSAEEFFFIEKIVTVGRTSVVLYSLDNGQHWDSNKKLLLARVKRRWKEENGLRESFKKTTIGRKKADG